MTGLRDVRAHRWLAWDDEPQTLEVTARRLAADGRASACTSSCPSSTPADGGGASDAGGRGDRRAREPPTPAPAGRGPSASAPPAPSRWRASALYDDEMFHGPCWQGVRAIAQTGSRGTVAELEVLPFAPLLRGHDEPRFALDPVVLDAAGQVVGFWTAEHLERGRVVFPFALDALDVYGPQRPAGEALTCAAEIELLGDQLVRSDIDVIDADGRAWMRLTGWEDKRFDVPPQLRPAHARRRAHAALRGVAGAHGRGLPARNLRVPPPGRRAARPRLLEARLGAPRALARASGRRSATLRLPERARSSGSPPAPRRRRRSCGSWREHAGLELLPADVEIGADEAAARSSAAAWLAEAGRAPVVSLAHTRGLRGGARRPRRAASASTSSACARARRFRARSRSRRTSASCSSRLPPTTRRGVAAALLVREGGGREGAGLGPLARAARPRGRGARPRRAGVSMSELGDEMARDHPDLAAAPLVVHSLATGRLDRRDDALRAGGSGR